ncbi:MAG: hypothetical protein KDE48_13480 [Anaerolineales bacterium]|nr:hypothetical protein [Anaerolineales bacterium]
MLLPVTDSSPRSTQLLQHVADWFNRAAQFLFTGRRQRVVTAVFLFLTVVVIGSLIRGNWETLRDYEWQIRPSWLIYAVLLMLIDMFLGAVVWHSLCKRFIQHPHFFTNIKIWWYANLARRIPGTVWFIASRAILYETVGIAKLPVTLLSGLEMVLIFVSGIITTLLTLPFWILPDEVTQNVDLIWFLPLIVILCVIMVHPRILGKIWQLISRKGPTTQLYWRDTTTWLLLYIVVWSFGGLVLFCLINFFQPLPSSYIIATIGMWALASTISLAGALTITGLGLREVSLTVMLTQVVPLPVAIVIVIVLRVLWLLGELITAGISLKL